MYIVTLHFIRNNEPDEILKIHKLGENSYKCVFTPGDRTGYSFKTTKNQLLEYVDTTLRAVTSDDVDPYEQVQISTVIHPRILFHVIDMNTHQTYERLWEMFTTAVHFPIIKNGLSTSQQNSNNAHTQRIPNSQTGRYFSRPPPEGDDC